MGLTTFYISLFVIGLQLIVILNYSTVSGQRQNEFFHANNRVPKTNFNCNERPAGYYADIETGCQVYHMCDGLGRQFSYTCPNTTLFQQRMLICDHWYMVNCSKAEKDYDANLLIGQRDKPFVRDDEYDVRTPRPDLLNRQYSSDYTGDYRDQFNAIAPLLNSLAHFDKKASSIHKTAVTPNKANTGHWSTVHPQKETFVQKTTETSVRNPAPVQNSQPLDSFSGNDLGTSSSQDSQRTQNEAIFADHKPEPKSTIKPPSIEFEPPFLTPTFSTGDNFGATASPSIRNSQFVPLGTTTSASVLEFTGNSIDFNPTTTNAPIANSRFNQNDDRSKLITSSVFNFGDRLQPTTNIPPVSTPTNENQIPVIKDKSKVPVPSNVLLPPFENINLNAGASIQGPPIYFEWKFPASGLEPPIDDNKSNGAITISDQVPVIPPEKTTQPSFPFVGKELVPPILSNANTLTDDETDDEFRNIALPSLSLRPPLFTSPTIQINNDRIGSTNHSFPSIASLHGSASTQSKVFDKSQTQRSVTTTTRSTANSITTKRQSDTPTTKDLNYLDLKRQLSIPEFTFPLEEIQRPSYTENNALNSFQIRIPDDIAQNRADISGEKIKAWYGENARCPECHPSFLKPDSCEPCIKFR